MSIKLYYQGVRERVEVPVEWRKFPAGETFVKLADSFVHHTVGTYIIDVAFEGNDDLFNLALLADAVRRADTNNPYIRLYMHYLPYARQDRVCAPGESLSLRVACDFINSLKFNTVACKDLHSDVAGSLLNNLVHVSAQDILGRLLLSSYSPMFKETMILVSPDAGANKKVLGIAKHYGYPHVVRADKSRDVLTGKITGTVVYSEHVGSKDFLIVDDICDGGRTFIELAKELRKLTDGKIYLYVTHGIFSAGYAVFDGLIDGIYVSNLMNKESSPLVTVL